MNLSWLGSVVFFGAYFVAWMAKELPHTTWVNVTAIAAVVIAVLLVVDNRATWTSRTPQA